MISPWHPQARRAQTDDGEALQTDVMRFMAITGICLMAIFSLVEGMAVEEKQQQIDAEQAAAQTQMQVQQEQLTQVLQHLKNEHQALQAIIHDEQQELSRIEQQQTLIQADLSEDRKDLTRLHQAIQQAKNTQETQQQHLQKMREQANQAQQQRERQEQAARRAQQQREQQEAALEQARLKLERQQQWERIKQAQQRRAEQKAQQQAEMQRQLEQAIQAQRQRDEYKAQQRAKLKEKIEQEAQAKTQRQQSMAEVKQDNDNATTTETEQEGFALRFASDQALDTLRQQGLVEVYAYKGIRSLKVENGPALQNKALPKRIYEMQNTTVPYPYRRALRRHKGMHGAQWAVVLPNSLQQRMQILMQKHRGGILVIQANGEIEREAA